MAEISVRYNSQCLNRPVRFGLYIPNDPPSASPWDKPRTQREELPLRTLVILHGYSEGAHCWVPERLAKRYNAAVAVPEGENSFWIDGISTGHRFGTMIGEELIGYLRSTFGLAKRREDTAVLGYSMGGFGALRAGLKYPEVFGAVGAMSSALIQRHVSEMTEGSGYAVANYEYYRECFGEPGQLLGGDNDPEALADRLLAEGRELPRIYMCCGTEDFLLENNREFHRFLEKRGAEHEYHESEGGHEKRFWDEYTGRILEWIFGEDK